MGSAMVRRLVAAGYRIGVWNRSPARLQALADLPLTRFHSVAELAKASQLIAVNVTATTDVESLLMAPDGVLAHAQPGTTVIDFSTIDSQATQTMAAALAKKNITLIDCPVSGGVAGAKAGTLTLMAGGDSATLARLKPILQHIGQHIIHAGPSGAGQAIKAANQLCMNIQLAGIAEALHYAQAQGADPAVTLQVLQSGLAGSKVLDWAGPHMVEGFTREPTIQAHLHAKDVGMAANTARSQGLHLPLLFETATLLDELIKTGPTSQDTARIFEIVGKHMHKKSSQQD